MDRQGVYQVRVFRPNKTDEPVSYDKLKRAIMCSLSVSALDADAHNILLPWIFSWSRSSLILQTNTEYIFASGASKFVAIALTYPYQVVRARIQNTNTSLSIPSVIRSVWRYEGLRGFYKGLGTNALRILPGTCTTFVVYENLVWAFRSIAAGEE